MPAALVSFVAAIALPRQEARGPGRRDVLQPTGKAHMRGYDFHPLCLAPFEIFFPMNGLLARTLTSKPCAAFACRAHVLPFPGVERLKL